MHQRRAIDRTVQNTKLAELADAYGMSVDELLHDATFDSTVPGICTNDGCDYTAQYEPDQDGGWCEACEMRSVASALILARLI
jgi:hypothetical protein